MIDSKLVAKQITDMRGLSSEQLMAVIDAYGSVRSEVLGYVLAFREHLPMLAMDELLRFFVFLALLYESAGYGRLQPERSNILAKQRSVQDQVRFVLSEATVDLRRSSETYTQNLSEPAIMAYAFHEVLNRHDMQTEAGVQMYIGVVSLVEIFSASAAAS